MPGGDGTGPMGMGPMTGRAAGFCAGYRVPGYMNPVPGRGFGMGFGRGRGWRNMFYATGQPGYVRAAYGMPAWGRPGWGFTPPEAPYAPSAKDQAGVLKEQAEFLEQQLEEIRRRLSDLETEKAEK